MNSQKISYVMCGLFELSHSEAFMLLAGSLSGLVILVQFDYKFGDLDIDDYI